MSDLAKGTKIVNFKGWGCERVVVMVHSWNIYHETLKNIQEQVKDRHIMPEGDSVFVFKGIQDASSL